MVGVANKRQHRAIRPGGRLDNVRYKAVLRFVIEEGKILAAAGIFRVPLGILFHHQFIAFAHELAFHVRTQIKIAAVGDPFQLAKFTFLAERKRVLHISRAHRVMRELVLLVITQNQLGGIDP